MTTTTTDLTQTDPNQNNEVANPIQPSETPMQYRAIGLLWGKYTPSEDLLTKGVLVTSDGTKIDAVILGKLLTLFKKGLVDLSKEHFWIVYPRTRDRRANAPDDSEQQTKEQPEPPLDLAEPTVEDEQPSLHVQLAGIWEPETLHPEQSPTPTLGQKPDYFSIQGEVVYQHKEEGWVAVKIVQKPQKPDDKPSFFSLKLIGFLPERPVKNFWRFDVEREGYDLVIQDGERLKYLGKKKPKKGPPKKKKGRRGSSGKQHPATAAPAVAKEPPLLKKKGSVLDLLLD